MPFKTPGRTSEYIRELLSFVPQDGIERAITEYADKNVVAVLLPETAAFLRQAVMLSRPERILEIGTAIGYSGILMLKAAAAGARLYTIELSEERIKTAKGFFEQAGLSDNVVFYTGDSTQIVPNLKGEFDFIFLDGPKAQYCEYLPFLSRLLVDGGVLFCDNVLYNGMVSGEHEITGHKGGLVKKLDLFLHNLIADRSFVTSILPVGDGVSLSIKKGKCDEVNL